MPPTLIDTNLLVYLYDPKQAARQAQAHRVLEQLELTRGGRLSVQALSEFFSVATRKLSPGLTPASAGITLLIVSPHPDNLYGLRIIEDLVNQAVLNIDSA